MDYIDPLFASPDFIREQDRDTSSCPKCGAREPVRIEASGCERCAEFPRCFLCRRWIGDGAWLVSSVRVDFEEGPRDVCDVCWERGEEGLTSPVDYSEDPDDD